MDNADDAREAKINDATAASFYNEPQDLPAVECGQAAQSSPVGPIPGDSHSPVTTVAAA